MVADEEGCFYMNPFRSLETNRPYFGLCFKLELINFCIFRETDEYKAYEQFSLTMGIFTMGETSSLGLEQCLDSSVRKFYVNI